MIRYTSQLDDLTVADLRGPFFVGWPDPPDAATHLAILRGSDHVVIVRTEDEGRVVGFVTAITDGVLTAYIPLLEVIEEYRGRGIGSELVRRLLDVIGPIYAVDAMCEPGLQPFYRHLGLAPGTGVMLRNYSRQSGAR